MKLGIQSEFTRGTPSKGIEKRLRMMARQFDSAWERR